MTVVVRAPVAAPIEWQSVSTGHPCPVCGANRGCRFQPDAFVCCTNCQSDWPMTNGAWLHRIDLVAATLPAQALGGKRS